MDIETRRWDKIILPGPLPSPRTNHKALLVSKSRIVIFGGYTELGLVNDVYQINLIYRRWEKPNLYGDFPLPRESCSMVAMTQDKIIIFGGYTL